MPDLGKARNRPSLVVYEMLDKIDNITHAKLSNRLFDKKYDNRIDIMSEDWDNLILLDACRYDYFSEYIDLDGSLDRVISKGGHSWEFMNENFVGRELHDTVYVTANLHAEKLSDDIFYTVETVPSSKRNPEHVVEAAKKAYGEYPNKRLIVHFMQPHRPYLGGTADELRNKIDDVHLSDSASVKEDVQHIQPKIGFSAFKTGDLPIKYLHEMYMENLKIAVMHTSDLLEYLGGKSVISSDHGELLGERKGLFRQRKFGHPHQRKTPEAYVIPWFTIQAEERREIISEDPIGFERLDKDVAHDRLRELGYVDVDI